MAFLICIPEYISKLQDIWDILFVKNKFSVYALSKKFILCFVEKFSLCRKFFILSLSKFFRFIFIKKNCFIYYMIPNDCQTPGHDLNLTPANFPIANSALESNFITAFAPLYVSTA